MCPSLGNWQRGMGSWGSLLQGLMQRRLMFLLAPETGSEDL